MAVVVVTVVTAVVVAAAVMMILMMMARMTHLSEVSLAEGALAFLIPRSE